MWDWPTYFLFLFLLLISYYFLYQYDVNVGKEKKNLLMVGLLPTFLLLACRAESTGFDLMRYAVHVSDAQSFDHVDFSSLLREPLFAVIEFLSNKLGGLRAFIIITSLVEYLFIYLAFRYLHKNGIHVSVIFIFLFAFVVLRSFNIVRNSVAWCCAFCAYTFLIEINKKRKLHYWLYTLMGMGIHITSVMNIPIYLTSKVPSYRNKKQLFKKVFVRIFIIVVLSFIVLYYGREYFFDMFISLTAERYNEGHFEVMDEFGLGNLLVRIPFLVFTLFSIPKLNATIGKNYIPFLIMLFLDIIISQLKYIAQDFERLAMYTGLGEVFLWGLLCMAYSKQKKPIIRSLFLIIGLAYYTYYMYRWTVMGEYEPGIGIMPYKVC